MAIEEKDTASSVSIYAAWSALDNAELWRWLNTPREPNFDDFGPATPAQFLDEMSRRSIIERRWQVRYCGRVVGYVAFAPQSPICGTFHGVCLAPGYRNAGIGRRALELVINDLLGRGYKKLIASFFNDNVPVHRLFTSLGFVEEGLLTASTMRELEPVDMRLMCLPGKERK